MLQFRLLSILGPFYDDRTAPFSGLRYHREPTPVTR